MGARAAEWQKGSAQWMWASKAVEGKVWSCQKRNVELVPVMRVDRSWPAEALEDAGQGGQARLRAQPYHPT